MQKPKVPAFKVNPADNAGKHEKTNVIKDNIMKIITNNKPRHIIYGFELSDKEKEQFDYLDNIDECSFFRYKGEIYGLGEFMRIDKVIAPHPQRPGWENWQGYSSDSYFSGVLVRYTSDNESVIVGCYFS